jgi:hypothetical protein
MKDRVRTRIMLLFALATLAAPAGSAASPSPDYRSSYPQLHELLAGTAAAGIDYKSSYPQLHAVRTHEVAAPAVQASGGGFDWGDAGIGVFAGALAAALAAASVWQLRRHRVAALE